ncbi:MAG: methylated-DNA--[protein]-cysteine S-methyltransferase, partial [Chloroflexota bacterium]
LQFLTLEYAKSLLRENERDYKQPSLLDITYDAGLSSPGRLHDLFVTYEAMTPGEYKAQGQGVTIRYGYHPSPFGECLIATTERGICGLYFVPGDDRQTCFAALQKNWAKATFEEDTEQTLPLVQTIFSSEQSEGSTPSDTPIKLLLKGTPFQLKVWQALLQVPFGSLVSYNDIAEAIEQPTAARAVGSAVGRNAIGYLIPCHRVIRKMGNYGPYRWGAPRKKVIIGWEAAQREQQLIGTTP